MKMLRGIVRGLEALHNRREQKEKEIIFIAENIKPRIVKIGYALKKKNCKVVLFLKKKNKMELKKAQKNFSDKIYFFGEKEDLYVKCLAFSPMVYHIFAEANVPEWAEYLLQKKSILGKIVYDQYDIYRGFVRDTLDEIAKREKYCLENADGLCCRMFETQYLKHKYRYRFQGKRILFLDYCWNTFSSQSVIEKRGNGLRFVYGGRLLSANAFSDRYRIERNGFEYIAKTLQQRQAYFVIITSHLCEGSGYSAYRALQKKYSHVLLKEPMSYKRLIWYESHMDYGIDCVELEEDMAAFYKKKNTFNMKAKNRYYATNKFFDYLDAGIMPIYGRKGELFGRYLSRFGGAVWCSLEEMGNKLKELKEKCEENKEKARRAREVFAIENQIDRLIAFYQEI